MQICHIFYRRTIFDNHRCYTYHTNGFFVKPVTTAGFSGFIQSIWGTFFAVVIITVLLEMLKSLVINPKAILGFEKLQNDKNVIQANRADGFFQ